tara:strand:- start:37263 stop:37427 length:165 start_codon:yes stop_codon:yes gene_type:complete
MRNLEGNDEQDAFGWFLFICDCIRALRMATLDRTTIASVCPRRSDREVVMNMDL